MLLGTVSIHHQFMNHFLYILKADFTKVSLLRGRYPGSGTLISPSPPEFQAVTRYMGHDELSSEIILPNDVPVTFTLSV